MFLTKGRFSVRARELERLLAGNGVGSAKLDAVTRKLRQTGYLPKSGRGPNAPNINALEAAQLLIAVAGSTRGTEADERLAKLEKLECQDLQLGSKRLPDAVANLLQAPDTLDAIDLIRIGRTSRHADFVYADGSVAEFRTATFNPARFRVEGIIPSELLKIVARALAGFSIGAADEGSGDD